MPRTSSRRHFAWAACLHGRTTTGRAAAAAPNSARRERQIEHSPFADVRTSGTSSSFCATRATVARARALYGDPLVVAFEVEPVYSQTDETELLHMMPTQKPTVLRLATGVAAVG